MKALYALLLGATVLACASVQPAPMQVGDTCHRCRRSIGDLHLAGQVIDQMRAPFPFRTAGCMAKYVKSHPNLNPVAIFVTDNTRGKMLPASDAWFVAGSVMSPDGKPESDYLAFRHKEDAEAARQNNAPVLRWAQVVADVKAD